MSFELSKAVSYRREKTLDLDLEFGVKLVRLNFSLGSPYSKSKFGIGNCTSDEVRRFNTEVQS